MISIIIIFNKNTKLKIIYFGFSFLFPIVGDLDSGIVQHIIDWTSFLNFGVNFVKVFLGCRCFYFSFNGNFVNYIIFASFHVVSCVISSFSFGYLNTLNL